MHQIIKSHLEKFSSDHALGELEVDEQFEHFANYCIISKNCPTNFDHSAITIEGHELGIDGIGFIIDEELVESDSGCTEIFSDGKRKHSVDLIFIQSKTGDSYDRGELLKFGNAVTDFVSEAPKLPMGDDLKECRGIFDKLIQSVHKISNGKPSIKLYYVTNSNHSVPKEILATGESIKGAIEDAGLFHDISLNFVNRDQLSKLYIETYSGVDSEIATFSIAALPKITGVEEAYLAVVKAKSFVEKVICDEDGNLRYQVFDENVRFFLGLENEVNSAMAATIRHPTARTLFPVLNNGITIVSPDVVVQNNIVHLSNFKIVNGCQTSNVLFSLKDDLTDDIMITIKIIETIKEGIFSDVVKATNNQTKVDNVQFVSLRPVIRRAESYFDSIAEGDAKIYLERRLKQFAGQGIPNIRIFDLNTASRCVAAMFCDRPDLSYKYHKQIFTDLKSSVFDDSVQESIFYAACLSLYRLNLYISNGRISPKMKKFKWHMLMALRKTFFRKEAPRTTSKDIVKQADKIIAAMKSNSTSTLGYFTKIESIMMNLGAVSNDRLKRQLIMREIIEKCYIISPTR